jgi:hypothetical protein
MPQTTSQRRAWFAAAAAWLLVAALLAGKCLLQWGTVPLHIDTDDAMRMVTATDLLHGQPWQDLIEHRDNVPYGGLMHWSRLVDAPIAALMAIATPLVGSAQSADVAAVVWPLLMLLPLFALAVAVTRRLVPEAGAFTALGLTALNLVLMVEFTPGRVDHHSVQILIAQTTLLLLLIWRERVWGGVLAGILTATALAIGLETLPIAIATILAYAGCWIAAPLRLRAALVAFGLSFATATAAHVLLAYPPSAYLAPACDALSIVYVAAAGLGAVALIGAAVLGSRLSLLPRLVLLAGLGVAACAVTLALYPQCMGGPYAGVDPQVIERYFAGIGEAQPVWQRWAASPASTFLFVGAALIALPLTAWRAAKLEGDARTDWLILLGFLLLACLVMLVQIRGARLAAALALPAGAWVIARARQLYSERSTLLRALGILGSWALSATLFQYVLLSVAIGILSPASAASGDTAAITDTCLMEGAFAPLAALPTGRVASPIGLSSYILRYTAHSVLSAGFHRNGQSIIDDLDFFAGDEARAHQIATERGLDYVVTCGTPRAGELVGALPGAIWSWLTPLSRPDEALQIFRVARR